MGEHRARCQDRVEGLGQPGDEPDAEDGVAAEGEEVVLDAGRRDPQDLAEDLRCASLGLSARRDPLVLPGDAIGVRGGQRRAVQLAVAVQRKRTERNEGGGDEVVRQRLGRELPQPLQIVPGRADDIGHQPLNAGPILAGDHGDVGDARAVREHGRHLAGLHPEAADLHLVVGAAQELHGRRPAAAAPGRRCGTSALRADRRDRPGSVPRSARAGPGSRAPGPRRQ